MMTALANPHLFQAPAPGAEDDWTGWTGQPFVIAGPDLPPSVIVGWTKGHFGIDWRPTEPSFAEDVPLPFMWCITHLPTGWGVVSFCGVASEARAFVDEISEWADWGLVTAKTAQFMLPRILKYRDTHPGTLFNSSQSVAPTAAWSNGVRPELTA